MHLPPTINYSAPCEQRILFSLLIFPYIHLFFFVSFLTGNVSTPVPGLISWFMLLALCFFFYSYYPFRILPFPTSWPSSSELIQGMTSLGLLFDATSSGS
jgi:uncharacterized membrane protein